MNLNQNLIHCAIKYTYFLAFQAIDHPMSISNKAVSFVVPPSLLLAPIHVYRQRETTNQYKKKIVRLQIYCALLLRLTGLPDFLNNFAKPCILSTVKITKETKGKYKEKRRALIKVWLNVVFSIYVFYLIAL